MSEIASKYPVIIDNKKYRVKIDYNMKQIVAVSFFNPENESDIPIFTHMEEVDTIDSYVKIVKNAAYAFIDYMEMEERKRKKETLLARELDLWNGVIETKK